MGRGRVILVVGLLVLDPSLRAFPQAPADPLAALGFAVTGGAAPGYVEDRACASCHAARWQSYQAVGMSRSFSRPRQSLFIEDFENGRFFHAASGQHYEMRADGDRLLFRRWTAGPDGTPQDVFAREVDWIVGSGHTSRVYLFQSELGELFQLPIAWYSQPGRWGMAPGYDQAGHPGVRRLVRRECLFCHNAYPDVAAGSDLREQSHLFPTRLPEGIGCQRCHGPGAEHVRRGLAGAVGDEVRGAIVNPARLPLQRRLDVCYQCHDQPSVAIPGLRRFGRADYSFRPGERLADYLVQLDVEMEGVPKPERFEINHHVYRLEQSRCFQQSRNGSKPLECLSCHDPHVKRQPADRPAHYRAACRVCHSIDACRRANTAGLRQAESASDDCVACHMPRRRTQDVVQVVMTDHLIQRQPGPGLTAALSERDPVLLDVRLTAADSVEPALQPVYRALGVLRSAGSQSAVDHLTPILGRTTLQWPTPYLDLARGQLNLERYDAAEASLRKALELSPQDPAALELLALADAGRGKRAAAVATLRRAIELEPRRPESHYNLGLILLADGRPQEALEPLEQAVRLRPTLARAWNDLGEARTRLGQETAARRAWETALGVEPALEQARRRLAAPHR